MIDELVFFGALSLVFYGCSSNHLSLSEQDIFVQKQNSEKVEILWVDVYCAGDGAWISGVLKQQHFGTAAICVHVDVQVLSPDGSVLYESASKDIRVPRDRIGKGIDWKRFHVRLPEKPTEGSRISMTVHPGHRHTGPAS